MVQSASRMGRDDLELRIVKNGEVIRQCRLPTAFDYVEVLDRINAHINTEDLAILKENLNNLEQKFRDNVHKLNDFYMRYIPVCNKLIRYTGILSDKQIRDGIKELMRREYRECLDDYNNLVVEFVKFDAEFLSGVTHLDYHIVNPQKYRIFKELVKSNPFCYDAIGEITTMCVIPDIKTHDKKVLDDVIHNYLSDPEVFQIIEAQDALDQLNYDINMYVKNFTPPHDSYNLRESDFQPSRVKRRRSSRIWRKKKTYQDI